MGRPLNKKFFGNRNIGSTSTTADNGIGGEGIASITWASLGTFRTTPAGLALPAPTIPGGVQAAWVFHYQVIHVSTGAGNTNLALGDKFAWPEGTTGLIATVVSLDTGSGNAGFAIDAGNGGSAGAPFDSIPGGTTQGVTLTKISGSGTAGTFLVDLDLHITIPVITEKGSGYTGAETFTVTVEMGGDPPAGTIVLTTDSGSAGSATDQENAIIIHANTNGSGTKIGDIVKQTNDRRYKVKTSDATAKCILVSSTSLTSGQAYIKATDTDGGTYLIEKLTAHMAVIRPVAVSPASAGTQFPLVNGLPQKVEWTMNGTSGTKVAPEQPYLVAGVSVKIENA